MIAPLYAPAMSDIEFLSYLAGNESPDGHAILRESWAAALSAGRASTKAFRVPCTTGSWAATCWARTAPTRLNTAGVASAAGATSFAAAPSAESLEVVFETGRIGDGRWWNNGWLQELPQKGTSVCLGEPRRRQPRDRQGAQAAAQGRHDEGCTPSSRSPRPARRR
jgi:hypothetical protein